MPITMPCAANLAMTTVLPFSPPTPPDKLLNALSQASYIHVREGRGAINFSRFNQAMMHATTSPLYAICASNDVAVSMMDGKQRPVTDAGSDRRSG